MKGRRSECSKKCGLFAWVTGQQESPKPEQSSEQQLYEVNLSGKKEKVTLSQLVDNFQKGWHYETKMSEIKKQQKELEDRLKKWDNWEQRYARMEEVDKFYQDNPDKLNYLLEQYERVKNGETLPTSDLSEFDTVPPEVQNKLVSLEQTVKALQDTIKSFEEEKLRNEEARIQAEVKQTFERLKDTNELGFLDWETPDENGLKLEDHILKFALDNNIPDVETATLKYCREDIFNHLKESGKREAVTKIKEGQRNGIVLGAKPRTKPAPRPVDTSKTYDDLAQEALAELNYNST